MEVRGGEWSTVDKLGVLGIKRPEQFPPKRLEL